MSLLTRAKKELNVAPKDSARYEEAQKSYQSALNAPKTFKPIRSNVSTNSVSNPIKQVKKEVTSTNPTPPWTLSNWQQATYNSVMQEYLNNTTSAGEQSAKNALATFYNQEVNTAWDLNKLKWTDQYKQAKENVGAYSGAVSDVVKQQEGLKKELERPWLGFTTAERTRIQEARGGKLHDRLIELRSGLESAQWVITDLDKNYLQQVEMRQKDRIQTAQNLEKMIELLAVPKEQKEMAKMLLERKLDALDKQEEREYEIYESQRKDQSELMQFYNKEQIKYWFKQQEIVDEEMRKSWEITSNNPIVIKDKIRGRIEDVMKKEEYKGVPLEWGVSGHVDSIYNRVINWQSLNEAIVEDLIDPLNQKPIVKSRYNQVLQKEQLNELTMKGKKLDIAKKSQQLMWKTANGKDDEDLRTITTREYSTPWGILESEFIWPISKGDDEFIPVTVQRKWDKVQRITERSKSADEKEVDFSTGSTEIAWPKFIPIDG